MATVADILETKGRDVVGIDADASVLDAVRTMVDANIGALLVRDEQGLGIFTERDFLRLTAEGKDPDETLVRDAMSTPLVYVTADTSIEESMALMTDRRIRHLPVVEDGAVVGMVSIGDLVKLRSQEQSFRIQYLTDYISAR